MFRMLLFFGAVEPTKDLNTTLACVRDRIALLARLRITLIGSGRGGEISGSIEAFGAISQGVSYLRESLVGIRNGLPGPHCLVEHPEALKYGPQLSKKLTPLRAPVHLGLAAFCSHLIHREPIVASRPQPLLQNFFGSSRAAYFCSVLLHAGFAWMGFSGTVQLAGTLCVITDD